MSAEDEDEALAELDQMIADADKVAEIPEAELEPQLPDVPSDKIPGETYILNPSRESHISKIARKLELGINSKLLPIQTVHQKVLRL